MTEQTILFTIMPRGMSLNSKKLPVSVLVSPRLSGSDKLGDYPDWLSWTQNLKENGLSLTVRCGTKTRTFKIDQEVLHPELWEAMFNKDTYVRSYAFKDYTNRTIFSYPARLALSSLKSTYQVAGLLMGLPDRSPAGQEREGSSAVVTMPPRMRRGPYVAFMSSPFFPIRPMPAFSAMPGSDRYPQKSPGPLTS